MYRENQVKLSVKEIQYTLEVGMILHMTYGKACNYNRQVVDFCIRHYNRTMDRVNRMDQNVELYRTGTQLKRW